MLITIEGIDGTGKTTLAKLLATHYKAKYIKFPSDSSIGQLIREQLKAESPSFLDLVSLQMLFVADKLSNKEIRDKNQMIIVDRYIDSAIVYGYLDNIPMRFSLILNKYLPQPDLTIILDANPEICLQRLSNRKEKEYYENKTKLTLIRETYKELPIIYKGLGENRKIEFLNAEKSIEEMFSNAVEIIDSFLAPALYC